MAINVDLVYKTVLLILNQQQRGNITPDEFNKVGTQVQLGIFEKYMSDLNQQLRVPSNDSEYGDRVKNIEEKIDIFKRIGDAVYAAPIFDLPTATDFYRLGSVIYNDSIEAQMVDRNEWYLIKKAPLVAPTKAQPVFLYENSKISMFPTSITSDVQVSYLKKPVDIKWGYSVGGYGQFLYDASSSVNFELHESDEADLVIKILELAGILIKDLNLYQVFNAEEQETIRQEKA